MRSDREPWFTPMRMAVWFSLQIFRKGTKRARVFSISCIRYSAVYSVPVSYTHLDVYKRQVGMIALGDDYHLGMQFEGCDYFVIHSHIGDVYKRQCKNLARTYERVGN